jgi:hypothetical protein
MNNINMHTFKIGADRVMYLLELQGSINFFPMGEKLQEILEKHYGWEVEALSQSEHTIVPSSDRGTITVKDMTVILRRTA